MMLDDPIDRWTENHIRHVIEVRMPEGQLLEYKREIKLGSPTDKAEAAKDVSAFANAEGGLLIVGIEEVKLPDGSRVPGDVSPITDGRLRDQLEDVLTSACLPEVPYVIHPVSVRGGHVLVLRITVASTPVMVTIGNRENRFYKRVNSRVVLMTERDLREAYQRGLRSSETVERLVREADPLPESDDVDALSQMGAMEHGHPGWLTIVAIPELARPDLLSPRRLGGVPINRLHPHFNYGLLETKAWGVEVRRRLTSGPPITLAMVRLHRNGVAMFHELCVRADYGHLRPKSFLKLEDEAGTIRRVLELFTAIYQREGYAGPLVVRGSYRHLHSTDITYKSRVVGRQVSGAPTPVEMRTSVGTLTAEAPLLVERLLDNLCQAAGVPSLDVFRAGLPEAGR